MAFGYTGQRNYSYIKLIDYGARWYDPALGRFIQPDSIIPGLTNSQAWNRYSYTFNNPIMYTDPSGHIPVCIDGDCDLQEELLNDINPTPPENPEEMKDEEKPTSKSPLEKYNITVNFFSMSEGDQIYFLVSLLRIINSASEAFINNFMRGMTFNVIRVHRGGVKGKYDDHFKALTLWDPYTSGTATHEIFHQIDYYNELKLSKGFEKYVGASTSFFGKYDPGSEHWPKYSGKSPPPNRKEDFAESAEEYFGFSTSGDPIGIKIHESRYRFFSELLSTGVIPGSP